MNQHPGKIWASEPALDGTPELVVMAKSMIAARRALVGPLPTELIHDPALDILLYLFVEQKSGHDVQLADVVISSTVPASVLARWVTVLEQYGLVSTGSEAVMLTEKGVKAVSGTIRAVAESQWHL